MRDPRYLLARVLWHLPRFARVFWGLFRDPRVPRWTKILPVLGVAYALFPFDAVTDFLVGLGWVDDVVVLYLCFWAFVRLSPPEVVAEHVARATRR
jgi:uncharacterized membrane protein YkvA (DUF1232 family)